MTLRETGRELRETERRRERLSHIADSTNDAVLYFQVIDKILELDAQSERLAAEYSAIRKVS